MASASDNTKPSSIITGNLCLVFNLANSSVIVSFLLNDNSFNSYGNCLCSNANQASKEVLEPELTYKIIDMMVAPFINYLSNEADMSFDKKVILPFAASNRQFFAVNFLLNLMDNVFRIVMP